jgi:pyruvate dehydrogenase E2 component (dihydrolipoamide acetyltransferase)
MPALGIAQETGKLLQWLKSEGQTVKKGEVLMVVETDKTTVEIEADANGILSNVTAVVGEDVPVGQVIALILAPGEAAPQKTKPAAVEKPSEVVSKPDVSTSVAASPLARRIAEENNVDLSKVKPSGEKIEKADVLAYLESIKHTSNARLTPASPKARVAADERGVDVAKVKGSGPEGAVLYANVMAAAATKAVAPVARPAPQPAEEQEIIKTGTIWRIMAERTTQSWTSVPHFYLTR